MLRLQARDAKQETKVSKGLKGSWRGEAPTECGKEAQEIVMGLVLGLAVALGALVFFVGWLNPLLVAEVLRDRLYCIRNTLFDRILHGGGPLVDPAHRAMRDQVNGLIYLARRIDFFVAVACVRKDCAPDECTMRFEDHTPQVVRDAVTKAQDDVHATLQRFIFRSCLSGVIVRPIWGVGRLIWSRWRTAPAMFDISEIVSVLPRRAEAFSCGEESTPLFA